MPSTKTVLDRSPFYALVGAADLAVASVRNSFESASDSAVALRDELTADQVQSRILGTVNDVREQLATIPGLATERYEVVAGTVERAYDEVAKGYLELVQRGEELTRDRAAETAEAPAVPLAPVAPKPAAKPVAPKKPAATKTATKRPAKKATAKQATAKQATAKQATAKQATAKKA